MIKKRLKILLWNFVQILKLDWVISKYSAKHGELRKLLPRHTNYRNESIIYNTGKYRINLDRSDYTQWKVFAGNNEYTVKELQKFVQDGDIILDVGANVGGFSMEVSHAVSHKSDIKIIMYEPNERIYRKLKSNIDLNRERFTNITFESKCYGIGDTSKTVEFSISDDHSGSSSVYSTAENQRTVEVEITTIDEESLRENFKSLGLIKVDVECFEPYVFMGAKKTIDQFKPAIYFEHSERCGEIHGLGNSFMFDFLADLGYSFYIEDDNKKGFIPISKEKLVEIKFCNVLATYF